jgi:hypothetical protein
MIGGAGLSTLGLWMVVRQGLEVGRPAEDARRIHARVTGALLIGLSTFQAEFDFGVPQFQLLFQPVLIASRPACAPRLRAVAARPVGRVPGARDVPRDPRALALFVRPSRGLHDAALPAVRRRGARSSRSRRSCSPGARSRSPSPPARASGRSASRPSGGGATSGWRIRGRRRCCAAALPLALAAGVGGALLGARISQSLALAGSARAACPDPGAVAAGRRAVLVALAIPLPRTGGDGTRAAVVPAPAPGPGPVDVAGVDPPRGPRRGVVSRCCRGRAGRPGTRARSPTCARRAGPRSAAARRAGRRQLEVDAPPRRARI